MKIACVRFENPLNTFIGGITTYVTQVSQVLIQRGYYIEVFAASFERAAKFVENEIIVNRIKTTNPTKFKELILPIFKERHKIIGYNEALPA